MQREAPSAPESDDGSELVAAAARDNAHFDYFQVLLRNKQTKRSVRSFWTLLRDALATVWSAARPPFVSALLLTFLNALIAVAQVLVTKQLLDVLLADTSVVRLGPLLPPVLILAGLTAASFALTTATGQVQRLLGELVMHDIPTQDARRDDDGATGRNAGFVVLDEPTSALDPRAEHDLFARMRDLLDDRTVLLISHRFSSVRHADRIYVLDGGRIVEHGSHDKLMGRGGLYAELFTLQAAAYLES